MDWTRHDICVRFTGGCTPQGPAVLTLDAGIKAVESWICANLDPLLVLEDPLHLPMDPSVYHTRIDRELRSCALLIFAVTPEHASPAIQSLWIARGLLHVAVDLLDQRPPRHPMRATAGAQINLACQYLTIARIQVVDVQRTPAPDAIPELTTPGEPDSEVGSDRVPTRYSGHGRKTIDRIRDDLGDSGFIAFCQGSALKYRDRCGRKAGATTDGEMAAFYDQMVAHVRDPAGTPDPRAGRPDFVPYARPPSGTTRP